MCTSALREHERGAQKDSKHEQHQGDNCSEALLLSLAQFVCQSGQHRRREQRPLPRPVLSRLPGVACQWQGICRAVKIWAVPLRVSVHTGWKD